MTTEMARETKSEGPSNRRIIALGLLLCVALAVLVAWLLGFLDRPGAA